MGQRTAETVDREVDPSPTAAATRQWLVPVLAGLAALFALTATWSSPYFVDAYTNALQARAFAAGSVEVEGYDDHLDPPYQGELTWLVPSASGTVAQYPPGTALWAAPWYLLDTSVDVQQVRVELGDNDPQELAIPVPSLVPAGIAAVLSVVIALGFLGASLQQLMPAHAARNALVVAALGTGVWSIAADMLWQHGPAMMGIAGGVFFASRGRHWSSGLGFAFAILVRPHTALVAAAVGVTMSVRRRTLRPALAIGATSVLGLMGVVAYNRVVFGRASISGGYGGGFADQLANSPATVLFERLVGVFIDGQVGMFIYSPVLIVAFLGLWRARKETPDWALGAAIGGALYLLVQIRANRISGGDGFFGYRYPLEALMAAAPMLALGARAWVADDGFRRRLLMMVAGASIAIHGYGAVTTF